MPNRAIFTIIAHGCAATATTAVTTTAATAGVRLNLMGDHALAQEPILHHCKLRLMPCYVSNGIHCLIALLGIPVDDQENHCRDETYNPRKSLWNLRIQRPCSHHSMVKAVYISLIGPVRIGFYIAIHNVQKMIAVIIGIGFLCTACCAKPRMDLTVILP